MKQPRRLHGATAFSGSIYVFGGCCNDPIWFTADAECYNIEKDEWTSLPPMPVAAMATAITLGDRIYIFVHGKGLFLFDTAALSYIFLGTFPLLDWHCFSVASASFTIFVCGGMTEGKLCCECYSFDTRRIPSAVNDRPEPSSNVIGWKREVPLSKARRRSVLVAVPVGDSMMV